MIFLCFHRGQPRHRRGLQGRSQRVFPAPGVVQWRHSGDQQEPHSPRRLLVGPVVMTAGIAQIPAQAIEEPMAGRDTIRKKKNQQNKQKNHTTHLIYA